MTGASAGSCLLVLRDEIWLLIDKTTALALVGLTGLCGVIRVGERLSQLEEFLLLLLKGKYLPLNDRQPEVNDLDEVLLERMAATAEGETDQVRDVPQRNAKTSSAPNKPEAPDVARGI